MAKKGKKQKKKNKKMNAYGYNYAAPDGGLFNGLSRLLPHHRTDQFLVGVLFGAAVVYVLSDEDMRAKLIKGGMKLYAGMAGGFEEIKEQFADIRAEMEAQDQGGA